MGNYELFFHIVNTAIQLGILIVAFVALSIWKKELRGNDHYLFAKKLLAYIREIRFLVHSKKGSWHQIYVSDFFEKDKVLEESFKVIKDEKLYFDFSVWNLFAHINTRSDLLIPDDVRLQIDKIKPGSSSLAQLNKDQCTYVEVKGVDSPLTNVFLDDDKEKLIQIFGTEGMTIKEYFNEWKKLVQILRKYN